MCQRAKAMVPVCIGLVFFVGALVTIKNTSASPLAQTYDPGRHVVVDDFEDEADDLGDEYRDLNSVGGEATCWDANGGIAICEPNFSGSQGRLSFSYDVTASPPPPTKPYALYSSEVLSLNATELDSVWLMLNGTAGDEQLYIELKSCGFPPQFPKVLVDDYLVKGVLADQWSAVAIPLTAFEEITDTSCIAQVNVLAHPDIQSAAGSVLLDNIQILPEQVVIDDFENQDEYNRLGGITGYWSNPEDRTYVEYSYPDSELKLTYDVNTTTGVSETIYWTNLGNTNLLTRKDVLSFDIRGEQGDEQVVVEFRDCGLDGERHIPKVKVSDYLPGGIDMQNQRASIPLRAFGTEVDWRCIENLNFLASSLPWFASGEGTIFVDNIVVAPTETMPPLMVDNFDDCNLFTAQLNEWEEWINNDPHNTSDQEPTIDITVEDDAEEGCRLNVDYEVIGDSSAWIVAPLDGLDASGYSHLRFLISGMEGDEELHVYLRDTQGQQRYYSDVRPSQTNQEVLIPLRYFDAAIDIDSLAEFKIAFEWKTMSGVITIDEVGFAGNPKVYLPLVRVPPPSEPPPVPPCDDTAPRCNTPDIHEPNNVTCSAQPLLIDKIVESVICSADDNSDYYSLTLPTTDRVRITLSDIPEGADYDVYIYDNASLAPLAGSRVQGAKIESFTFRPPTPDEYFVRVYRMNGYSESAYKLEVVYD